MLYVQEEEGGPKPEEMAAPTRKEHSPSVANLMGDSVEQQRNFLQLGALFEAQNAESNATDTESEASDSESISGMGSSSSNPKTPSLSFDI